MNSSNNIWFHQTQSPAIILWQLDDNHIKDFRWTKQSHIAFQHSKCTFSLNQFTSRMCCQKVTSTSDSLKSPTDWQPSQPMEVQMFWKQRLCRVHCELRTKEILRAKDWILWHLYESSDNHKNFKDDSYKDGWIVTFFSSLLIILSFNEIA